MKPLQDDILTLRAIEVTDVDTVMAWENDSSQWDSCNTSAPFSRKQLWDYAVNYNNDIYATGAIRLMVVERSTNKLVGSIDIYDFNRHHNRVVQPQVPGQEGCIRRIPRLQQRGQTG